MVSDASKKKAAAKKAAAAEKRGSKSAAAVAQSKLKDVHNGAATDNLAEEMAAARITDRTCTGVLASHPQSRDIHVRFLCFVTAMEIGFRVMAWNRLVRHGGGSWLQLDYNICVYS